MGKGWNSDAERGIAARLLSDALLEWWKVYRQQWTDMVKEGLDHGHSWWSSRW